MEIWLAPAEEDSTKAMEYHEYIYNHTFSFEAGGTVPHLKIAYHTSGPCAAGRKVIWICHALTANSDAEDWWPGMVGSGKVIDTDKYFVVCVNMIGSCYGSSGPSELKPSDSADGRACRPYLFDFPDVTVRDMVRASILVRRHLGVEKIDLLVGSSIGGFQAVEWLVMEPDVFGRAVLMATSARISPWLSAWEEAQRMSLEADATFRHPELALGPGNQEPSKEDLLNGGKEGLKAARAVALISYRSYDGYNSTQQEQSDDTLFASRAASYERHQGQKLADRFDAYSYYSLSKSMDSHNVGRGRGGVAAALARVKAEVTVVGIDSDGCFPPAEVREISRCIPNSEYREITSAFGHDGFLLENEQIGEIITGILEK